MGHLYHGKLLVITRGYIVCRTQWSCQFVSSIQKKQTKHEMIPHMPYAQVTLQQTKIDLDICLWKVHGFPGKMIYSGFYTSGGFNHPDSICSSELSSQRFETNILKPPSPNHHWLLVIGYTLMTYHYHDLSPFLQLNSL